MFWDPPKAGGPALPLERIGHPGFESPRKREAQRSRLCPYLRPRETSTRRNGGQRGPMGKIERVGPKTGHGLASDALSGAVTGL